MILIFMDSKSANLAESKSLIMAFLKNNGPSIPIKLSSHLKVDTLLASAFLADLLSDKQIKISNMKVGNSPIYFLAGQESELVSFSNYLGGKEREAFELIKERKILKDVNQNPPIRVALRSIKDFAFPFRVRDELFWRYYLVDHDEALGKVSEKIEKIERTEKPKTHVIEKIKQVFIGDDSKKEIKPENAGELSKEMVKEEVREISKTLSFTNKIENFLNENKFQVVRKMQERKKDFLAVVRLRTNEEIQDYLCIGKDKKSITESDVLKFLDEGKKDKMPVLIFSTGEVNKKAQEWLDYLKPMVNFKKVE